MSESAQKLLDAMQADDVDAAREWLMQDADRPAGWEAAFYDAVEKGQHEMVALCAPYFAVGCRSDCLAIAAEGGQDRMVELSISLDADLHDRQERALSGAVKNRQASTVRLLIRHGADISGKSYKIYAKACSLKGGVQRDEIIALIVGEAMARGCHYLPIVEHHRSYREKAAALNALTPAARHGELLEKDAPTPLLRMLAGAKLLPALFVSDAWCQSKEARALYQAIREALPEYRGEINGIDMTHFKPEALPGNMVSRIGGRGPSIGTARR